MVSISEPIAELPILLCSEFTSQTRKSSKAVNGIFPCIVIYPVKSYRNENSSNPIINENLRPIPINFTNLPV